MSRITLTSPSRSMQVVDELYRNLQNRIAAAPLSLCPIDTASAFLKLCHSQSCGKCVPCRIGLGELAKLLDEILDGTATPGHTALIEQTAKLIYASADCAIGYEAANAVLKSLGAYKNEYAAHIQAGGCTCNFNEPVPCVSMCPANVDVPGYIALIHHNRCADSVRLIRKDNPFPTVCAFVCEHPCEHRCRRSMLDSSINIRALKRFAVENCGSVPIPKSFAPTGKKVAVVGGGPSGLTAAYFLQLMGHSVTVFEKRKKLGGMLRYGIPNYRLPRNLLENDIAAILETGVKVETECNIDAEIFQYTLQKDFDSIYISIGAHTDKKLGLPGEESRGVISAVDMLRGIGDEVFPAFEGKKVVVIGGGNVAMDVARTAVRLGAESIEVAYRRRKQDMTALAEEVEGAIVEGCEIMELHAPVKIEADKNGSVCALWLKPQVIGEIDSRGRAGVRAADLEEKRVECDIIIVAVGQNIESEEFEKIGLPTKWGQILAESSTHVKDKIFAGGDCVTGPSTVIKAIAAGKVAAANIDNFLGNNHEITANVEIPPPCTANKPYCAQTNLTERPAAERIKDFELVENGMTKEEAMQEATRCLRCDYYGYSILGGKRSLKW